MMDTVYTDVFICGAGPVGLLLAYQLARMNISTHIVDRYNKAEQAVYGRATTLFPRSLEMLDQLDLLDEMTQTGVIARSSVAFKNGKRVTTRGWNVIFNEMGGTYLDYLLNLRQRFSEGIFRDAYKRFDDEFHSGWTLREFEVDETSKDGYSVASKIEESSSKSTKLIKSKYIIGADGGNSTVRRLAGIEFHGDETTYRWIRIDGVFKTNMPDAEMGFAAVESETHGNVLWVQLDHGVNRIGFSLTPELYAKYGDSITVEQAKEEARKAMAPFELEISRVEWWTLYHIKQKVAERFVKGPVILAGDACHTHSSGAAQGMNTGVHDAVNLGWKLGGVIKGWFGSNVLDTYDTERRTAAQTLIQLDKGFSATISGRIPDEYKSTYSDPHELLNVLFSQSIKFNVGLGINFAPNILNRPPEIGTVTAGWRGPDCLLYKPGLRLPLRLFDIAKNTGVFWILVFVGQPLVTSAGIQSLRKYVDGKDSFTHVLPKGSFRFLTILAGEVMQPDAALGVQKFGKAYYDVDNSAHSKYGISTSTGAVAILRPDGIFGFAAALTQGEEVGRYFMEFMAHPTGE